MVDRDEKANCLTLLGTENAYLRVWFRSQKVTRAVPFRESSPVEVLNVMLTDT